MVCVVYVARGAALIIAVVRGPYKHFTSDHYNMERNHFVGSDRIAGLWPQRVRYANKAHTEKLLA